MGKSRASKNGPTKGTSGGWSKYDQNLRVELRLASIERRARRKGKSLEESLSSNPGGHYKRTAFAREASHRKDHLKLKMHIRHIQRDLDVVRERLTEWDEVKECQVEQDRIKAEEKKERKRLEDLQHVKTLKKRQEALEDYMKRSNDKETPFRFRLRRRPRAGPETWKLKGAARPAWEVYDFDTRYECPHLKAHEEEAKRQQRLVNILATHRGNFAAVVCLGDGTKASHLLKEACRTHLSLLMQMGTLCVEAKRMRSAKDAFVECIELEGDDNQLQRNALKDKEGGNPCVFPPITNARCRLMRMYLETNRPHDARALFERFPRDETAWIRYGAALIEYVSWKLLEEPDSTSTTARNMLVSAIRANVFCAYHLAYHADVFVNAMEYAEDVEDADEGTLEEAIEYCASEQMGLWLGTEGALEWIKEVLEAAGSGRGSDSGSKGDNGENPTKSAEIEILTVEDLDWKGKLEKAEVEYKKQLAAEELAAEKLEAERLAAMEDCNDDDDNSKDGSGEENDGSGEEDSVEEDMKDEDADEESEEDEDDDDVKVDFLMYAGMYRTAMDMLQAA